MNSERKRARTSLSGNVKFQSVIYFLIICTGCSRSNSASQGSKATNTSILARIGFFPSRPVQKETTGNGLKIVPYAADLEHLFPTERVAHLFSQAPNTFDRSDVLLWNTIVLFGGKYVLTYQVEVVPDFKNNTIKEVVGKPRFVMEKIGRLFDTPGGLGSEGSDGYTFNGADFEKVLAAGGDFSVIGIHLDFSHPLARFDHYVDYGTLDDYKIVTNPEKKYQ